MIPRLASFLLSLLFLIPLSTHGQGWQWAVSSTGNTSQNNVSSMAADPQGNVFVTGLASAGGNTFGTHTIAGSNNAGQEIFVTKTDAYGNFLWAIRSDDRVYGTNACFVAADRQGNCYLWGSYINDGADTVWSIGNVTLRVPPYTYFSEAVYFLAKIDAGGTVLWAQNVANYAYGSNYTDGSLALDDAGHIYVSGAYDYTEITIGNTTIKSNSADSFYEVYLWIYGTNMFVACYDENGNNLWARNFGGTGSDGIATYLAAGPDDGVYFSGYYQSPAIDFGSVTVKTDSQPNGGGLFFLSRLDSLGNTLWAKNVYDNANVSAIKADAAGNVYMAGYYFGDSLISAAIDTFHEWGNEGGLFISKYDAAGNIVWTDTTGRSAYSTGGISIDINHCGNLWVSGNVYKQDTTTTVLDFSGYPLPLLPGTQYMPFLLSYDSAGNFIAGIPLPRIDTYGQVLPVTTATDLDGNIYVGSTFNGTSLTLGPSSITDTAGGKLYIAKYTYTLPQHITDSTAYAGICAGSYTTLQAAPGYLHYQWADSTTTTEHTITTTGTYTVLCTDMCTGNALQEAITATDQDCNACIVMPTAFSPNNDGRNDTYGPVIKPWCNLTIYSLRIYDRWGQEIFHSTNATTPWDGTCNGNRQDIGTYEYLLEYGSPGSGEMHRLKGDLVLVR